MKLIRRIFSMLVIVCLFASMLSVTFATNETTSTNEPPITTEPPGDLYDPDGGGGDGVNWGSVVDAYIGGSWVPAHRSAWGLVQHFFGTCPCYKIPGGYGYESGGGSGGGVR